eukprot:jgi/Chrzof1/12458/Cz06g35030.t1
MQQYGGSKHLDGSWIAGFFAVACGYSHDHNINASHSYSFSNRTTAAAVSCSLAALQRQKVEVNGTAAIMSESSQPDVFGVRWLATLIECDSSDQVWNILDRRERPVPLQ